MNQSNRKRFFSKPPITTLLCCLVLLGGCRMRDAASEEMVIPQAVRTHLYVAPGGSDSNPGTLEEPFRTLTRAAQAATPGTTVFVAPGMYMGGFKTTASGTPEARIIYRSSERWAAKIVPPLDSSNEVAWDNRGNYVDIVGFEVDGSQYQSGMKWLNGIYNGGSYNSIRHNHVHHIANDVPCESKGGSGIGIDGYYKGVKSEVIGNSVHDVGSLDCRYVQGIYISTSATVKNNIVYRISGAGIHLWHDANNVIVSSNTVSTSNTGIVVGGGDFYHTKGPNDHTHVSNNIVFDNKHGILEQGATGEHNSYRNNLVFQNEEIDWKLAKGRTHSGTVTAPPLFVNYSRNGTPDFRPSAKSPAIGKGIDTDERDFLDKPRGRGAGIDIGAIQH